MRRERGQAVVNQATVNGRYTDAKITVNGDWAIERYTGVLRVTPKTGGAATEDVIKGIHIYHRQPDGSWRMVQDVWNHDAPGTSACPAARKLTRGSIPGRSAWPQMLWRTLNSDSGPGRIRRGLRTRRRRADAPE
jgi:hypothetical protein